MIYPDAPAHPCRPSQAHKGLTIRQAYAMAAMQSLSQNEGLAHWGESAIAESAFAQADAMIAFENGEVNGE